MGNLILKLVVGTPLLAVILGPLVLLAIQYLKRASAWFDGQGAATKQAVAVVLAFLLVGVSHLVAPPAACSDVLANGLGASCWAALMDPTWLQGLLTALVAVAVKHGQQVQQVQQVQTQQQTQQAQQAHSAPT